MNCVGLRRRQPQEFAALLIQHEPQCTRELQRGASAIIDLAGVVRICGDAAYHILRFQPTDWTTDGQSRLRLVALQERERQMRAILPETTVRIRDQIVPAEITRRCQRMLREQCRPFLLVLGECRTFFRRCFAHCLLSTFPHLLAHSLVTNRLLFLQG